MKTIILAGGLGTRLSEETANIPKPMVSIDGKPILWHVMNIYARQGFTDFIVATGYKHQVVDEWVNSLETTWNISTFFTGSSTQTAGRIRRIIEVFPDEKFLLTYGDGLANVNIEQVLEVHRRTKTLVTVTAVRPPARFGVLTIEGDRVEHFGEKLQSDSGWINGGFFVISRLVSELIASDDTLFETGPLPELAKTNQLSAYRHDGFWQPMDTLREKHILEQLVRESPPPWLAGI